MHGANMKIINFINLCPGWQYISRFLFNPGSNNFGIIFLKIQNITTKSNNKFIVSCKHCISPSINNKAYFVRVGRDISVGTTTRYGLDGRGLNPGESEILTTGSNRSWDTPNILCNG
jgi:hypothetical protein